MDLRFQVQKGVSVKGYKFKLESNGIVLNSSFNLLTALTKFHLSYKYFIQVERNIALNLIVYFYRTEFTVKSVSDVLLIMHRRV